jgi:TRAP-type C4-dicarboxylate transport system permease small subunit
MVADHVSHIITIAYCLFILYASGEQALRALFDDTTLSTLPLPIAPAYCLVPLGFLALAVAMIIDLPRVREGNSLLFNEDAPTS